MPLFDPVIFDPAIFDCYDYTGTDGSITAFNAQPKPIRKRQTQKILKRVNQAEILQLNIEYLRLKQSNRTEKT